MITVEPQKILQLQNLELVPSETIGEHLELNRGFRRMVANDHVKAFSAEFAFPFNQKATLLTTTGGFTSIDNQVGVFGLASQQPFVFQLIKQVPIITSFVATWQEGGSYVDFADVEAENAAAPEPSSWTMSAGTLPVRKIFSLARASQELWDDFPIFNEFLNEKLARVTLQRLDNEIINGDGTGSHLTGILGSSPTVLAKGALTRANALLTAISRVRSIGFGSPSAIIMNYADALELQTDQNADNVYTAGAPGKFTDRAQPIYQFGGVPVLQTDAIAANNVLVGDFSGAILFMRKEFVVETSDTDASNWVNNVYTLRASLRAVLFCHTPTKFVSITGF
jgi:HK97 family phage major capsid protein